MARRMDRDTRSRGRQMDEDEDDDYNENEDDDGDDEDDEEEDDERRPMRKSRSRASIPSRRSERSGRGSVLETDTEELFKGIGFAVSEANAELEDRLLEAFDAFADRQEEIVKAINEQAEWMTELEKNQKTLTKALANIEEIGTLIKGMNIQAEGKREAAPKDDSKPAEELEILNKGGTKSPDLAEITSNQGATSVRKEASELIRKGLDISRKLGLDVPLVPGDYITANAQGTLTEKDLEPLRKAVEAGEAKLKGAQAA